MKTTTKTAIALVAGVIVGYLLTTGACKKKSVQKVKEVVSDIKADAKADADNLA